MIKKLFISGLCLVWCLTALAGEEVEMADMMRSSGKIYVVVGTILLVFAGMIFYIARTDMKLNKLEKYKKERK